jgi:hypothetical protein
MADMEHARHAMKGMASEDQLARLAGARGTAFDRLLLQLMIPHHQGALDMVQELLRQQGSAYDQAMFQFTSDVTTDQKAEIDRMNTVLAGLSGDPRATLSAGVANAGEAISNLRRVASLPKPAGFFDPANPAQLQPLKAAKPGEKPAKPRALKKGDEPPKPTFAERGALLDFANTDMAFANGVMIAGSYHGFNACSGNGIVLDISNPLQPRRIDDVADQSFAYWHSATFNNDGTKVLFTDEWGGGMRPRCQAGDPRSFGADAFYAMENGKLVFRGHYKLPAPQTDMENCVAHNGSIVPVPGRDLFVQAWYQGGISVIDFTDAANPREIAYFDRGPIDKDQLVAGGYWSAYWYKGRIYATEITRGIDVFALEPSANLTKEEIAAAEGAIYPGDVFNPQTQTQATWPAALAVAAQASRAAK